MTVMCKMISPGLFNFFFKILILWIVSGVKGIKMTQNDKKLCLLRWTSKEPLCHLWCTCVN